MELGMTIVCFLYEIMKINVTDDLKDEKENEIIKINVINDLKEKF